MAFFDGVKNFIGKFREAAQAGKDFNPLLESVEKEIESLHAQGKLDDVLYKAEQEYTKEHGAYMNNHSGRAADSMADINALKHFLDVLSKDESMDADLKAKAASLLEVHDKMLSILGPLGNIAK